MRISIRFDAHILPFIEGIDRDILQLALRDEHDTSHLMKRLSAGFKDCILAIAGPQSADLLDVDPSSCSTPFLDLSHFPQTIEFSMQHISNLPPWTTGKRNGKGSSGDRIVIERLAGPPYLQGDYKAVDPKGAMDFAVSAFLRDVVWLNGSLALVSAEYLWDKQYLAERCNAPILKNLLHNTIRFGMGDDTKTYGEAGTVYKAAASAPFRALNEISNHPVRLEEHDMHSEAYVVDPAVRSNIAQAVVDGRRVIAIGTTTTRVLETIADPSAPSNGRTSLLLQPGVPFRTVGALVTNFHLPRSTLLALVMGLAGESLTRDAYAHAVREGYRFYSFGDAMVIV